MDKTCSCCKRALNVSMFHKNKAQRDGFANQCKLCTKEGNAKAYAANPAKFNERSTAWAKRNQDAANARARRWRAENPEASRAATRNWAKRNPEKEAARQAALRATPERKEYHQTYERNRRKDPGVRLHQAVSSQLRRCLKGAKARSAFEHLPYTIAELKAHLEAQFEPWMTWANFGDWHIDHIRPVALFNLPDEIEACWALSNLQPLRAVDNIRKGKKLLTSMSEHEGAIRHG